MSYFAVFIFTSRDIEQVKAWMEKHADMIPCVLDEDHTVKFWNSQTSVLITRRKLPAVAYLDDRAVRFTDWDSALPVLIKHVTGKGK